jgi:hypothetical protein
MLRLTGAGHIRTHRHLRGFRAIPQATGYWAPGREEARLAWEAGRLAARQGQRRWRQKLWQWHFIHVAGPCRVLPPAARMRLSQANRG